jgi:hypothetical protein
MKAERRRLKVYENTMLKKMSEIRLPFLSDTIPFSGTKQRVRNVGMRHNEECNNLNSSSGIVGE